MTTLTKEKLEEKSSSSSSSESDNEETNISTMYVQRFFFVGEYISRYLYLVKGAFWSRDLSVEFLVVFVKVMEK